MFALRTWGVGCAVALLLAAFLAGSVQAAPRVPHPQPAAGHKLSKHKNKIAKKRGKHRRHGKLRGFSGRQVAQAELRHEPLPRPSGHLRLYAVNFLEELEVYLYDKEGRFSQAAIAALNHFWRCRRTNTEKPIDPRLYEMLSIISDHFGGREIELVSGFRNQPHQTSYHFHGSASDIRIAGVSERALQQFAATLDNGGIGIGIYPRGGFVHVDVRAPEPSYRWVDYSPPGGSEMAAKTSRKRQPNS